MERSLGNGAPAGISAGMPAEGGSAPSTPPSIIIPAVEYASDPESAGARRRDRLLGLSSNSRVSLRLRVGKRRPLSLSGGHSSGSPPDTVEGRSVAATVAEAVAAAQEGKGGSGAGTGMGEGGGVGGGEGRRSSTGSRLGAMLRRGTPSLHNFRTYSTHKIPFRGAGSKSAPQSKRNASSSLEAAGTGDLDLLDIGDSPPVVELDDPPTGHYGRNDIADVSNSTSGHRRPSTSNSATSSHRHSLSLPGDSSFGDGSHGGSGSGGESDGEIGKFSAALIPDDGALNGDDNNNDDRGRGRERGGASGPAQSKKVSRLARKAIRPTMPNGGNEFEPASLSSDSEVSGGEDEREPGQPLSAAVAFFGWRRDHSAPPCSRSPPTVDRVTLPRPGSAAAAVGRVVGVGDDTAPRGGGGEEGGGAAGAVAAAMAFSRSFSSSARAGDDSTSSATEGVDSSGVHNSSQGGGTDSSVGAPSELIVADAEAGAAAAQMREGLGLAAEDRRSVGQSSAAATARVASGTWRHKTRRRAVDGRREKGRDGYVSAPDVSRGRRGDGTSSGPSEIDERVARSRTVLFAADSAGGSEMSVGNCRRRGGEGGGAAATTSGGGSDDDATLPASSATPVLKQSTSHASGRGGSTASSTRRKIAGLLHFRRRRSVGDTSASGSAGSPPHLSSGYDAGEIRDTALTAAATGAGALDARERVSRGAARPARSSLRRSSSTSSLGERSMALAADDDDHARAAEGSSDEGVNDAAVTARRDSGGGGGVSGDVDGDSNRVTRGRSARRRLLPSRSSQNPSAGASASLEPKRYRGSLLEAGKHKLRRGRNKLSRSSFGGGESSRRSRSMVPVKTSRYSQSGGDEEEQDGIDDEEEQLEVEGGSPTAEDADRKPLVPEDRGPSARPQLGTTYTQRPSAAPIDSDTASPWNTWGCSQASDFRVRTKGYAKSRLKAPSAPALYELVSIDAYSSPAGRLSGVYPLFDPPAGVAPKMAASSATPGPGASNHSEDAAGSDQVVDSESGPESEAGASGGGTGHPDIPPTFVVNCQLPDVPTPFSAQGDGPTVHVTFIFRATPQLRRYASQMAAEERAAAAPPPAAAASPDAATVSATAEPPTVEARPSNLNTTPSGEAVGDVAEGTDSSAEYLSGAPAEGEHDAEAAEDGRSLGKGGDSSGGGEGEGEGREVPGSVRLLAEWTRRAEEDGNFRGRFKAIGDIINADEVGLPSIAKRFRGKPLLVYGKESSVVRGDGFVELDLNAHAFSYVGRKGLYVTLDKWKTAIFRIGFLIEGRTDEEQPEHMLGCGILKGLDMSTLSELSLSSNGERLVVRNRGGGGGTDSNDENDSSSDRDASTNGTVTGQVGGGSDSGVLSSTSFPTLGLFSSSRSPPRRAESAGSAAATVSSSVPLIPRRHIALLRRRGRYSGLSNGDCGTDNVYSAKASYGDGETVSASAVAAAAFAGGWFCALLLVVTVACWVEVSSTAGGGGPRAGEEVWWRASVGSWLVRAFTDA